MHKFSTLVELRQMKTQKITFHPRRDEEEKRSSVEKAQIERAREREMPNETRMFTLESILARGMSW